MENTQKIIFDTVATTLAALRDGNNIALPENAPTLTGYRKHIIWLKRTHNEENKEVVINAEVTINRDCNSITLLPRKLLLVSPGYYQIDYPPITGTLMGCAFTHSETLSMPLEDNVLAYDSAKPIVLHVHQEIDISYAVRNKIPTTLAER